jgi:hypothetical protein
MVSLASDVRLRRSAQRWGGRAFKAADHHDQLNTPDTRRARPQQPTSQRLFARQERRPPICSREPRNLRMGELRAAVVALVSHSCRGVPVEQLDDDPVGIADLEGTLAPLF